MGSQKQSHRVRRICAHVERLQDSYIDEIDAQQRKIETLTKRLVRYQNKPSWWKFWEHRKWKEANHEND